MLICPNTGCPEKRQISRLSKREELLSKHYCEAETLHSLYALQLCFYERDILHKEQMFLYIVQYCFNLNVFTVFWIFVDRHTLWRRVQAVVTPFLAQLISVIDRNCNLDLLLDTNSEDEVKNLWLLIFENKALLDIPYIPTGQMWVTLIIYCIV